MRSFFGVAEAELGSPLPFHLSSLFSDQRRQEQLHNKMAILTKQSERLQALFHSSLSGSGGIQEPVFKRLKAKFLEEE